MKLLSLLFLAAIPFLPAATLTVTSTADSGPGSLRDAIASANHGDIITFGGAAFTGPENSVVIRLTSGYIDVTRRITILGLANGSGGNKVIISGDSDASGTPTPGDTYALRFQPANSSTDDITLDRITVRDCASGGAIVVVGTNTTNFIFRRCRFINNVGGTAGVLFSNSAAHRFEFDRRRFEGNTANTGSGALNFSGVPQVTLSLCDFSTNNLTDPSGSGGALSLRECPSVLIDRCLFSENGVLNNGGAIYLSQTPAAILGCLFQGNTAEDGGSVYIDKLSAPVIQPSITQCTFNGNQTTGTGAAVHVRNFVDLLLEHCTVTANISNSDGGSGDAGAIMVANSGNVRFSANIIAGNSDGRATGTRYPDVQNATGTITSLRGNVIGDSTGSGRTFEFRDDVTGTSAQPISSGLLPLADNGGATLTHALHPLAAAVNFAKNSIATEDQRGEPRPSGGEPDAGAFERQVISFEDWAADRLSAYPVSERQENDDPDDDGLSNSLEFIQGTAPAIPSLALDRIDRDENGMWYSYTISNDADIATLAPAIEESDDLIEWLAKPIRAGAKSDEFVSTNATRSRYRLPISTAGRPQYFFRMNVLPFPQEN